MSLNPTSSAVPSVSSLPRDSSSVGSVDNENLGTVTFNLGAGYTPVTLIKKRKVSNGTAVPSSVRNSGPSTSSTSSNPQSERQTLSVEEKVAVDNLIDNIIKVKKDFRRCELAVGHYENLLKTNSVPKDIDIDVKFANPYPRAVSQRGKELLSSLAQKEKDIWNEAKAKIIALRLETLKETLPITEERLTQISDVSILPLQFDSIPLDTLQVASEYFVATRNKRVADLEASFAAKTKAYEARQAKKLSKRQEKEAVVMETDQPNRDPESVPIPTEASAIVDFIKSELKSMITNQNNQIAELKKEMAELKRSNNRKNVNAPDRKGRGNPVPQEKGRENNNSQNFQRPNNKEEKGPYYQTLMRPAPVYYQPQQVRYVVQPQEVFQQEQVILGPRKPFRPKERPRDKNPKNLKKKQNQNNKGTVRGAENRARR